VSPQAMETSARGAGVGVTKRDVRAKLPSPPEHQEQALLFQWAQIAAGRHPELRDLFAIPNAGGYTGGFRQNVARVAAMKREGVASGVPDICLPHARGTYHALYIELKRVDATASDTKPAQRDWHMRLRAAGNCVVVCAGWEAARRAIEEYLTLTPTEK
jgi:hypothetical protein